jgi:hypothetical protein|tara:strand:+ start:1306 stop:2574 length:1269 start_codon:yes stop_codon:yes gene_type:complete
MVRRELGEGRWDKVLMRRMVNLSVADNYDEAKEEWLATGNVWWRGNGEIPEWVTNSQQGVGSCLCGHRITYHFEILNTENGIRECVGSDHINSYLIMRQIAEEKGQSIETITEEQIQEWINVRVGSMKAEAWWKENGESFEMMFNKIKEIDVRYNTRSQYKEYHYDKDIREYVYPKQLRKKSEGEFGTPYYKMASIVWRWNHPDNPKNQQTTRGYPNDRLMQDLALYFIKSEPLLEKMNKEKERRKAKILKVKQLIEEEKVREEKRRTERVKNSEFRNLRTLLYQPFNAVWEHEDDLRRQKERKAHLERVAKMEAEKKIADDEMLSSMSQTFEDMCEYYGMPVFDETFAGNEWEREFLVSIKYQLNAQRELSTRQLQTARRIFEQDPPSDAQVKYLRDLGYEGRIPSKRFASKKIKELKGER